jgi:hypothetical protein
MPFTVRVLPGIKGAGRNGRSVARNLVPTYRAGSLVAHCADDRKALSVVSVREESYQSHPLSFVSRSIEVLAGLGRVPSGADGALCVVGLSVFKHVRRHRLRQSHGVALRKSHSAAVRVAAARLTVASEQLSSAAICRFDFPPASRATRISSRRSGGGV